MYNTNNALSANKNETQEVQQSSNSSQKLSEEK